MWVNKKWTLKELHMKVFEHLRQVLAEWVGFKDEEDALGNKSDSEFPYQPYKEKITKQQFQALDNLKAFDLCFPGLFRDDAMEDIDDSFSLKDMPYRLSWKTVKKMSSYSCSLCQN